MEDRIISAVSIKELLDLKQEVLSMAYSDHDSEYYLNLIEWSIEEFQ